MNWNLFQDFQCTAMFPSLYLRGRSSDDSMYRRSVVAEDRKTLDRRVEFDHGLSGRSEVLKVPRTAVS